MQLEPINSKTLAKVRRNALAALRPPKKQALSDWIENEIWLPNGVTATPGRMRLWPYQRAIADAIGDPSIERVTLVKPVRVGFSSLLTAAIASHVVNDPAQIMLLQPTEADCRDVMVSDIEPVFAASPSLAGKLDRGETAEGERNTLTSRRFAGGFFKCVAAKSPRNLRRHNVRVLFMDEIDGMQPTSEGDPLALAVRRTLQFTNRKIVAGSTPVFSETSRVLRLYGESDERIFEVACPECGDFHELRWRDICWPEGEPGAAYWACPSCGSCIDEKHKSDMVQAGRWRALKPEIKGHAGFRLSALVSQLPNASWGNLATEFVAAKRDPALLQGFVNTILAEGWQSDDAGIDDNELVARREPFGLDKVPAEVLVITAGVDVQRDRLECTFLGFGDSGDVMALGHTVIWGSPETDDPWRELDGLLAIRHSHTLGGKIGVDAAFVDSGDGATIERVYSYCRARAARRIFACKGVSGNRPWAEPSKSKRQRLRLFIVGVDGIKRHIHDRIEARSIKFSTDLPDVWFEQLASERALTRMVRGQPVTRFERIAGRAAEALDCTVYALAARTIIATNWEARRAMLSADNGKPKTATAPKRVIKSGWMQ